MAFDKLPYDVVRLIIAFEAPELDTHFLDWRNALRLISVSQVWRAAGFSVLYSTAFIHDALRFSNYREPGQPVLFDTLYGGFRALSNIELIQQLGGTRGVTRLVLEGCELSTSISLVLRAIDLCALNNCSWIQSLRHWSRTQFNCERSDPQCERECFAGAVTAASYLVQLLPNVRMLRASVKGCGDIQLAFVTEILYLCVDKVSKIEYEGPAWFSEPIKGRRLDAVDIAVEPHVDGKYPVIDSRGPRSISISLMDAPFGWTWFQQNELDVSFDCLANLTLVSAKIDYVPTVYGRLSGAQFPQLVQLCMSNVVFSTIDPVCLTNCPVQCVELTGPASHMPCYDWTQLTHLHTLKFNFGYVGVEQTENNFIAHSNRLFGQLRGAMDVCVQMCPSSRVIWNSVYWPRVSRMEVVVVSEMVDVLVAVRQVPDLVYLGFTLLRLNEGDIARVLSFLRSIENEHEPITESKLETIVVRARRGTVGGTLTTAFESLKLYYPRLQLCEVADLDPKFLK
ncbi:hypothetical protein GGF49_002329 [Coemansia sp. RSA 1853]|nr:hypothetical protein LPJ76_004521 [Coemansia sp. RSA 638]KAJ2543082.1 hypothetical protein GGF49_002329 [Coemansia sp. RSA 1853]